MRRFELIDGSSQKFWEIELQGSDFTVRWGRIGTDGQSQQKSFPSAAKAQTEHDKLVTEKQKKGYAENTGGTPKAKAQAKAGTPEPAPEPAPVRQAPPAPAAPDTSGPIFWTENLLGRVQPRRGGVTVPIRALLEPKKAWAVVREDFKKRGPDPAHSDKHRKNLAAHTKALVARVEEAAPRVGSPEEDAVLLAYLQHKRRWDDKPRVDPAIDLLFALGGPVHATRALLLSLDIHVETDAKDRVVARKGRNPKEDDSSDYDSVKESLQGGLSRLRALLTTQAGDSDHQAARTAAAAILREGDKHQRSAAAFLFPSEAAWVRDSAQAFIQKGRDGRDPLILHTLSDLRTLDLVTPHVDPWLLLDVEKEAFSSLLDGVGPEIVGFLRTLLVGQEDLRSEQMRTWAEVVASINSDEAMTLLLERPESEIASTLIDAALRWPHRAARLVPRWALPTGKEGASPRNLLSLLLARHPAAVQAALAGLSDKERDLMVRLQAQASPNVPDAPAERLPPVLATPPWLSSRRPEAPPELNNVTPPALPDALVWHAGEQEAWLRRKGWNSEDYEAYTEAKWHALEKKLAKGMDARERANLLDGEFFGHAPQAFALKYLDTFEPNEWNARWMPRIIARLGLDTLAAMELCVDARGGETHELCLPFAVTRLAPRMAEALGTKKGRGAARDWLLRHPAHATSGLLAPALGKPGKVRDAACAALRLLAAQGQEATVLKVAGDVSPQVREAVTRVLAFDPLYLLPAKLPKLPTALGVEALPPPLLADRSAKLPPAAVEALATMLAFSSLEEPYVGLEQVKAACDRPSLARFAWALFETWLAQGASNKEGWVLQALGLLGDDDTARKLAPLIRQWPGEAAHARAVTGLDVLATIGTDVTLIYLNGIAEKVKFKGLQQKAQEKIEQIAETRGLTREELADRLVPDLGLDERGSLSLDFGPRTFTVGFDEQLKPFVRDSDGAALKDLPKPIKKDDADKAEAAEAQWKALKKDAKVAAGIQILRLELAMCARRRWSPEVFRPFFVEHPLLIHVVRRLVWGVYSPEGALKDTFRVAEDRSFSDVNDDTWTLPEDALVGLPHALELDAKTSGAWGQLFADYQLIQPFPQLGRPTYALQASERGATKLERVVGLKVPTGKVLNLEKRGWRRGAPQDGGVVCWMEKPLGPGLMAELDLEEGIYTGMIEESPEQVLGALVVRTGEHWDQEDPRPLGELDSILFSELVRDLESLRPA